MQIRVALELAEQNPFEENNYVVEVLGYSRQNLVIWTFLLVLDGVFLSLNHAKKAAKMSRNAEKGPHYQILL